MTAKLASGGHLGLIIEVRACRYALGSVPGQWHGHSGHCCLVVLRAATRRPVRRTRGAPGGPSQPGCESGCVHHREANEAHLDQA